AEMLVLKSSALATGVRQTTNIAKRLETCRRILKPDLRDGFQEDGKLWHAFDPAHKGVTSQAPQSFPIQCGDPASMVYPDRRWNHESRQAVDGLCGKQKAGN
ncbi:MAG: hypothetical protein ABL994_07710, partial [Verrucomicrobiales bacterium]